jgi:hypothetical protein
MSPAHPRVVGVKLTPAQRRTLDELIRPGRAPPGNEDVEAVLQRLEEELREECPRLRRERPLRLSKRRLSAHDACPGWFQSELAEEGGAFAHGPATAVGSLTHRAIQLDIACERGEDVRTVVERAALRLSEQDPGFGRYWRELDRLDRAEHLALAAARLALFRTMFPPLERSWQLVPEQFLAASLARRAVVLSGRVDLMLGRGPHLLIDFKTGEARSGYAEDMRFYALVVALGFGVAPYRVATVFCESMEWQSEEVTAEVLEWEAAPVIRAARSAALLSKNGQTPALTPGPHCRRCPRALRCPSSAAR